MKSTRLVFSKILRNLEIFFTQLALQRNHIRLIICVIINAVGTFFLTFQLFRFISFAIDMKKVLQIIEIIPIAFFACLYSYYCLWLTSLYRELEKEMSFKSFMFLEIQEVFKYLPVATVRLYQNVKKHTF